MNQLKNILQSTSGRSIWVIFGIGLLLRWAAFYYHYFIYQTPGGMGLSATGDEAITYDVLARQLLDGNGFVQELFSYRPPLQPMFIALVYTISQTTNPLVAAFCQTFVSSSIIMLAYLISGELGASARVRNLAGLIVAIDPASIIISLTLMAETLSNFFLATSLLFLVRLFEYNRTRDAIASAAAMALATLARPTSVYFFVFAAIPIILLVPRWPKKLLMYVSVFCIAILPWYLRNHIYNNMFTFSTVGNFDLLFYKGVSVKHWATGETPTDIEEQLAYEVDQRLGRAAPRESYDYSSKWKFLVAKDPNTNRVITEMAIDIFRDHPVTYLLVTPIHLAKILAITYKLKMLGNIVWLELLLNVLFYITSIIGLVLGWKRRHWNWLIITVLPCVYFIAVPLLAGGTGMDTRARTPFTPCLAIMAATGVVWTWDYWIRSKQS